MVAYSIEQKRDIAMRIQREGISSRSLHRTHQIHYKSAQRYLNKLTNGYPMMAGNGRPRALSDNDVLELARFIATAGGIEAIEKKVIVRQLRELSNRNWYRARTRIDENIAIIEKPKKLSWKTEKRYIERANVAIATLNLPITT